MDEKQTTDINALTQALITEALRELHQRAKAAGHKPKDIAAFLEMEYSYYRKTQIGINPIPLLKFVKFCFLVNHNPFKDLVSNENLITPPTPPK